MLLIDLYGTRGRLEDLGDSINGLLRVWIGGYRVRLSKERRGKRLSKRMREYDDLSPGIRASAGLLSMGIKCERHRIRRFEPDIDLFKSRTATDRGLCLCL